MVSNYRELKPMNKLPLVAAVLLSTAAFAVPTFAEARQVTFDLTLNANNGNGAYVVIYLTDSAGNYKSTLWMAGDKEAIYRSVSGYARASDSNVPEIAGITGAVLASGKPQRITVDIPDALFNANYNVHVGTDVAAGKDNPSEIVAPLHSFASGRPFSGSGYVHSFRMSF